MHYTNGSFHCNNTSLSHLVQYLKQLTSHMSSLQYGTLSTLMGRYYAMDRDKRYDRIKIAFEGMVEGKGEESTVEDLAEVRQTSEDRALTSQLCIFV